MSEPLVLQGAAPDRDLTKLAARRNQVSGIRHRDIPVLWTRSNFEPWRVFVPRNIFLAVFGPETGGTDLTVPTWVEVDQYVYFGAIEPHWRIRG